MKNPFVDHDHTPPPMPTDKEERDQMMWNGLWNHCQRIDWTNKKLNWILAMMALVLALIAIAIVKD